MNRILSDTILDVAPKKKTQRGKIRRTRLQLVYHGQSIAPEMCIQKFSSIQKFPNFSAKKKAGAVFVDLTEAYDIVRDRGLICKLLRYLPHRRMISMIMELRDQLWLPSCLTSTHTTCQQQPPESSHMLTICQSCTLQATGRRKRGLLLRTWHPCLLISVNGSSSSV